MIKPKIDERCTALGITVAPPTEFGRMHWELTHLFLFSNGNWETAPDWALQFRNDHLGGDTHGYVLAIRLDGSRAKEGNLFYLEWPDGHHFFSPVKEHEWFGNVVMSAGFDWRETPGPYSIQMNAISSSRVNGLGLPYPDYPWATGAAHGGLHTSYGLVFQEVEAESPLPGCIVGPLRWIKGKIDGLLS